MRIFTRATSIVAVATATALAFPTMASADDIGEIRVAASASGNDLTVTFTDDLAEDVDLKYCFVFIVNDEDPERLHRVIRVYDENWSGGDLDTSNLTEIPFPEGGEFAHTYTDLEDGAWQVVYNCGAGRSTAPGDSAYWANGDEVMPGMGPANREPIVITLPHVVEEPGCTGLACLLLSGSAG